MVARARRSPDATEPDTTIIWDAQPRQAAFIACPADDVGFGGARGGGKTDAVIGDWVSHEEAYGQHAIGLVFRRDRTQLIELMERSKQVFRPLGFQWFEQDKYFKGPKGGRLRFAYLENDSDADSYQGHSYTRLYPEEMGTFPTEAPLNKMTATLRSGNGVPCQMKGTCNPGGPGHQWVKARYRLGEYPQGLKLFKTEFINPFTKEKIEKTRIFIPSKVIDNRYLGSDYVANLFQVGSETLVKAWLAGDWSVVEGAFFDCWSSDMIIRPCVFPDWWAKFQSGDWGSARPFSFDWWIIAGDDFEHPDGFLIPRGAIICYRQHYGCADPVGAPNVGVKRPAEIVAQEILQFENGESLSYRVLDPAAFSSDGGPSIAERMYTATSNKLAFRRADNARIARKGAMGGWDQLRARMLGENGRPMIYFFSTCTNSIRTIPALQHDDTNAEDVDSSMEDHAADSVRYACMSRPYVRPKPVGSTDPQFFQQGQAMDTDALFKPSKHMERRL